MSSASKLATGLPIKLTKDMPEYKYYRYGPPNNNRHWGQRKLLLSEVEFLTLAYKEFLPGERPTQPPSRPVVLIYPGAADGRHIAFLAKLFPHISYHLYDPRDFHPLIKKSSRAHIYQQFFEQKDAEKWSPANRPDPRAVVLLCSDIRSMNNPNFKEISVNQDMQRQKEWFETIEPDMATLKFRLPFTSAVISPQNIATNIIVDERHDSYQYLDGDLYLQCFAPQTSTETRLICRRGAKEKQYDVQHYERQMAYFNAVIRPTEYANALDRLEPRKKEGMLNTYDFAREIGIIQQYLRVAGRNSEPPAIISVIRDITAQMGSRRSFTAWTLDWKGRLMFDMLKKHGFIDPSAPQTIHTYDEGLKNLKSADQGTLLQVMIEYKNTKDAEQAKRYQIRLDERGALYYEDEERRKVHPQTSALTAPKAFRKPHRAIHDTQQRINGHDPQQRINGHDPQQRINGHDPQKTGGLLDTTDLGTRKALHGYPGKTPVKYIEDLYAQPLREGLFSPDALLFRRINEPDIPSVRYLLEETYTMLYFYEHIYDPTKTPITVLVGSVDGPRLEILAKCFPAMKFLIYRPRGTDYLPVIDCPNVEIRSLFFDNEDAAYFNQENFPTHQFIYMSRPGVITTDAYGLFIDTMYAGLAALMGMIQRMQPSLVAWGFRLPTIDDQRLALLPHMSTAAGKPPYAKREAWQSIGKLFPTYFSGEIYDYNTPVIWHSSQAKHAEQDAKEQKNDHPHPTLKETIDRLAAQEPRATQNKTGSRDQRETQKSKPKAHIRRAKHKYHGRGQRKEVAGTFADSFPDFGRHTRQVKFYSSEIMFMPNMPSFPSSGFTICRPTDKLRTYHYLEFYSRVASYVDFIRWSPTILNGVTYENGPAACLAKILSDYSTYYEHSIHADHDGADQHPPTEPAALKEILKTMIAENSRMTIFDQWQAKIMNRILSAEYHDAESFMDASSPVAINEALMAINEDNTTYTHDTYNALVDRLVNHAHYSEAYDLGAQLYTILYTEYMINQSKSWTGQLMFNPQGVVFAAIDSAVFPYGNQSQLAELPDKTAGEDNAPLPASPVSIYVPRDWLLKPFGRPTNAAATNLKPIKHKRSASL